MELPIEITKLISLTSNGKVWIYITIFVILSYLLISLFTWSFKKPLMYLAIPSIIVGSLLLIIRFFSSILLTIIPTNNGISIISAFLPGVLKPILLYGIVCILVGIAAIVLYKVLTKKKL